MSVNISTFLINIRLVCFFSLWKLVFKEGYTLQYFDVSIKSPSIYRFLFYLLLLSMDYFYITIHSRG